LITRLGVSHEYYYEKKQGKKISHFISFKRQKYQIKILCYFADKIKRMLQTKNITGNSLIPFILKGITKKVMEKKKLNATDAFQYVVSSQLYTKLQNEDTKYWYLSTAALFDELEREKKHTTKKQNDNILLFTAFCIENYQSVKNKTKEDVLFIFSKYNVYDYLEKVYEPLHTQGVNYIIDKIELFIKSKKK
jgi:hypothetical protein